MAKRISKAERGVVYAIIIIVDIAQIILDFFAVGVVINRILDIVVGLVLFVYGFVRKIITTRIALGIVGSFVVEEIPIVDVLPMWTLDLKFMYSVDDGKSEEEAYREVEILQRQITDSAWRLGITIDETRRANALQKPLNQSGKRLPPSRRSPIPPKGPPQIKPGI